MSLIVALEIAVVQMNVLMERIHYGGDSPCDSFEDFQNAYKYIRNAQDIGYKWAAERKDAL